MTKETKEKQDRFLAAYSETGNVTHAAKFAEICRTTHYIWLRDKNYEAAFFDAKESAIDALAGECRRRAMDGTSETVWYQGIPVGTVQRYSDVLMMFLLKSLDPAKYRDNPKSSEDENELNKAIAKRLAEIIAPPGNE